MRSFGIIFLRYGLQYVCGRHSQRGGTPSGRKKVKKSAREASDRDGRSPLLSPTIDYLVRSKSMHSNPFGDTFGKGERVRTSFLYLNVYKRSGRSREELLFTFES